MVCVVRQYLFLNLLGCIVENHLIPIFIRAFHIKMFYDVTLLQPQD